MKRSKAVAIMTGAIVAIFAILFTTVPAIAKDYAVAPNTNTILRKAMLEDTYYAYDSHHLQDEIVVKDYNGIGAIAKSSSKYNLPLVYTNKKNVKSSDFFAGKDGLNGAFPFFEVDDASTNNGSGVSTQAKISFLTSAGYEVVPSPDDDKEEGSLCAKFYYTVWKYDMYENYYGTYSAYSDYICMSTTAKPTGSNGTYTADDYWGAVIQDDPYIKDSGEQPEGVPSRDDPIVFSVKKSSDKIKFDCDAMKSVFGADKGLLDWINPIGSALQDALQSAAWGQPIGAWAFLDASDCTESTSYVVGTTTYRDLVLGIVDNLMDMSSSAVLRQKDWSGFYQYFYAFGSNNYDALNVDGDNPFGPIADVAPEDNIEATYKLSDNAKQTALNTMTGTTFSYDNTTSGSKFTKEEKFILYDAYVKEVFEIDDQLPENTTLGTDGYNKIRLINAQTGDVETSYVKKKNNATGLARVNDNYHFSPTETVTFADVANYLLNETSVTHIDPAVLAQYAPQAPGSGDGSEGGDPATGESKKDCYTGAGSLGWVVCPIINDLAAFIKDKYEQWVEPALQINTNLFSGTDGSKSTYAAWNVFRNIANVAFVIIFLIIIFSQLTGVGIDNYGIKKILPKLIIGAILINLSYVICQLAIDIANIVGYGIAGIFKGIIGNIGSPSSITLEQTTISASDEEVGWLAGGGGLGIIVVLIVGVISTAAILSQGTAIIIPVLLAVIGVAISLFTLIAILGMRQAAAVLLVVASPLAFVCYMLPNTKKLFDKWLKVLEGLLIAFPACSALIYGGDMVGRILLNSANGSTWVVLSAAIVSIAPIFFIPKLIKTSMGAVSNVASRITGGLNKAARGGINGSQFAKGLRADNEYNKQRRATLRNAGYRIGKDGKLQQTRLGKMRDYLPKTAADKAKIARARSAAVQDYENASRFNKLAGSDGRTWVTNSQAAIDAKLANQDIQDEIAALSNDPKLRTMDGLKNEFTRLMHEGVKTDDEKLKLKAIAAKLSTSGAGSKIIASTVRGKEGKNNAGSLQTLAEYSTNSDLEQKVAGKDMYASQYLEDLSAAPATDKDGNKIASTDFDSWMSAGKKDSDGKTTTQSNRDWVTENRLNKNDLFSQSGAAISDALETKGRGEVSATRIASALANQNLDMDDDVKNKLRARIGQQAAEAAATNNSTSTTTTAAPAPAPAPAPAQSTPTQSTPAQRAEQAQRFAPATQRAIENENAQAILNSPGAGPAARRDAQQTLDRNKS